MAARLRDLDPVSRATFDLVALAGRPLSRTLLGSTELAGLEAAGLVLIGGGADRTVTARHALLAETAVALMDDVRRRQAHATVARLIADPGESARHHEQAGERELALDKALRAADGAGTQLERAGHLRLAARMASGPEADRLRLRAARVFDAVQDWVAALEVLDAIEDTDPEVQAWVALLTARSAWKAGRADLLRSAIDTGLALTEGSESEVAVRLRVERTRVPLLVEFDARTAADRAGEGLTLARRTGVAVGRALYYLGTAVSLIDDPAAVGLLVEAIERAGAEGDIETEFAAAYNLINYHEFAGDPVAGRRLAERMIERAEQLRSGSWVSGLTVALAGLLFHAGELQATLDTCRRGSRTADGRPDPGYRRRTGVAQPARSRPYRRGGAAGGRLGRAGRRRPCGPVPAGAHSRRGGSVGWSPPARADPGRTVSGRDPGRHQPGLRAADPGAGPNSMRASNRSR